MHILVTNDDGPPSDQSSPYVHSLVSNLQAAGHTVSVVLPHTQRSWIGKAHLVGKPILPTYFRPSPLLTTPSGRLSNTGTTSTRPLPENSTEEEWILVDSTPASCVQIGLFHYFEKRGNIDLVVSGPNYGRNSTAVFSLSSGTIGGAMEAAVCGVKSIALSYAFFDRNHDPDIIAGASALSVKLIEHLYKNWNADAHLYSVNVPLVENVAANKILYTEMLQNTWRSGSCFQVLEVPSEADEGAAEVEAAMRKAEERQGRKELAGGGGNGEGIDIDSGRDTPTGAGHIRYTHKHFKWAPRFKDVYQSVEESEPGNDGWAVAQGCTSVTPLRANFMHVGGWSGKEINLE
ncbi:survival protein sure-like phosphatase/nucleotidase [Dendryphion nanum]|uniref:Survival protein sure-like phosphatase/nucleotidase n=1 Tax=Dendryphion nanum TaxID=256645 RepID=A0A9P9E8F1_9PLEO|nr:survival protein sure-like phosphatase/nucleotidase [Dendryphion nanum]